MHEPSNGLRVSSAPRLIPILSSVRATLAHSPGIAQQLLRAGLLDEIQLRLVPILLGAGRRLFENTSPASRELQQTKVVETPGVTHLRYRLAR